MVGDGGAWNRFEFAKVPFFECFLDPETEPEFPLTCTRTSGRSSGRRSIVGCPQM